MNDRLSRLEAQLNELAREVESLHDRLRALESRVAPAGTDAARDVETAERPARAATSARESDTIAVVSLVGRTLVVLAGAYLLRALTDNDTLDQGTGVVLGMAYALTWIVMADRAGARGRRASAAFHGVAFVLIALPLLFEATARFRFLDATSSAAALGVVALVSLAAAGRQRLRELAWITTLGALFTTFALMVLSGELGPYAVYLTLLGIATLWFGYVIDWVALRWPVAFVLDMTVLILALRAVSAHAIDTPAMALTVQVLMLSAYLGSFAGRTLFLNRDVIPFEVMQSVAVIVVGLGGAAYVTGATGVGTIPLGIATLGFGASAYAVAIAFVERRQRRRKNFYFYTTAALVFTMAGSALVLPPGITALVWAALALVAAWSGRRTGRVTFQTHSAVYATGAAVSCGLLPHALHGLGLPVAQPLHEPGGVVIAVLAATAACTWTLGSAVTERPPHERIARLALLTVTVGGIVGIAADWLVPPLAAASESAADPGIVATLRTALLVGGVLLLAWAGGARGFVEASWLVYPLLAVIGVKFIFEDLRASRPATLFLAFALYGAALIWGPRLRRTGDPSRAEPDPDG